MKRLLLAALLLFGGQAYAGDFFTGLSYGDVDAVVDGTDYGTDTVAIHAGYAFNVVGADLTVEGSYSESDSSTTRGSADYSYSYQDCGQRRTECDTVDVPLAYDWSSKTESEAWTVGMTAGKFIGKTGLRPYVAGGYSKVRAEANTIVNLNGSVDSNESFSGRDDGAYYGVGIEYVKRAVFVRLSYTESTADVFSNLDQKRSRTAVMAGIRF
jgi:hypothetical protein